MTNTDEKFIFLFAVVLLIVFIVLAFEYFKKEKEKKEFLEWLKNDNFSLYEKYKNKTLNSSDKFSLIAGKVLFLNEKKKGKK